MNTKTAYQADENGIYIGESMADEDPMNPGAYLLPRNASFSPPPRTQPGEVAKLSAEGWAIARDFFGEVYWMPDRTKHVMHLRGTPLPDGATLTEPEPTPEQKLLARKRELLGQLAGIDAYGARPAREVALAMAAGKQPPAAAVSRLTELEAQAATLRAELATLT